MLAASDEGGDPRQLSVFQPGKQDVRAALSAKRLPPRDYELPGHEQTVCRRFEQEVSPLTLQGTEIRLAGEFLNGDLGSVDFHGRGRGKPVVTESPRRRRSERIDYLDAKILRFAVISIFY